MNFKYYEMAKAEEQIKNDDLYRFINPERSREIGTTPFKKEIDVIIKNEKLNKNEINTLQKKIKAPNIKIQKHISLPSAVYLVRKKIKNISSSDLETIIRAQKDYFYKSFPKKNDPIDAVSKKLVQQLGSNKDITANQIAFAAYYRWGINKILSAKTLDQAFEEFPQSLKEEANDLTSEQKEKYLSRLKASLRPYQDNEIINKAISVFNIAGEKVDINLSGLEEVKDIALNSIIDDEIIIRSIQSGTEELTRATMGSRKIVKKEKKAQDLKAQKDSGIISASELEKQLLKIPGYANSQKTKRERITDILKKASEKQKEIINNLLELQSKRKEALKEPSPEIRDKKVKKINQDIFDLDPRNSSLALWKNFKKSIKGVTKAPEEEIKKNVKKIVNKVIKKTAGPQMSDDSMSFVKDLFDSYDIKIKNKYFINEEEVEGDDDNLSFYSFLSDLRRARIPKGIIEPYSSSNRHKEKCEECQKILFDEWKTKAANALSDIKSEIIRDLYRKISSNVFQTNDVIDDDYLSDRQYTALKGSQEIGKFEKQNDAKRFIKDAIQKHIDQKPGIPQGVISKLYRIERD